MSPGLWFALVTLVVGWLALAPAARRMGPLGYHVAAFPVGLLGWTAPALVAISTIQGYSPAIVAAGLGIYITVVWIAFVIAGRRERRPSVTIPTWSFIVVGGLAAATVLMFEAWGVSVSTYDGWGQYELESWRVHDTGRAGMRMLSARMIALPAAHAGYHFLGGEYGTILYPLMSLSLASLVGAGVWWATRGSAAPLRLAVVLAILAGMASNVMYLFMSVYMHSHTMIAGFLLLSVIAVERATAGVEPSERDADVSQTWLLVAGLAMAGFVLARPDSPAYVIVPLLTAVAMMIRLGGRRDAYDMMMAPLTLCLPLYAFASMVQRGWWTSNKSSARMLLAFAAVYAVIWVVLRFVPLERIGRLRNETSFLGIALVTQTILVLLALDLTVFGLLEARFAEVFANQWVNMTQTGGWGSTWLFVLPLAFVSIVLRPRTGRDRFRDYLGFTIVEFFIVAVMVHGVSHVGRIGWGDSLNRVTFHALPVFYVYLGTYVGELLRALKKPVATEST